MPKIQFNFKHFFLSLAIASFLLSYFFVFYSRTLAATGINRTINFQGKLVNNPAATNVTDTSYTVVFTLYNNPTAGQGTALWTETQTVTTVDGIFRVALGSVTPIPSNFNFNWDGLYLGIKVNSDSEMTPRVQMAAVPFAFNAQQVAGLTVQDTSGNASTSGTLQIANAKTINLGTDNLTFTTGGTTTLILPTTGTLLTNTTAANQTITSTQTTGTLLGLTDSTGLSGAITGMAITLSGTGVQDQTGLSFNLSGASGTNLNDIVGTGSSWKISKTGALTVASCSGCGGVGSTNYWGLTSGETTGGLLYNGNQTTDFAIAGTSTASALFSFSGVLTGNTIASVSGELVVMPNNGWGGNATISGALTLGALSNGTIETTKNQPLTLGGTTTGSIQLSPKGTTGLYVDPLGNVGIATTATVSQIQVSANTLYSNSESSKHGFMIASGDVLSANTELYMGTDDTNSLSYIQSVGHNGFRKLILQGRGGNVSIGTATNSNKLDVAGGASFGSYSGTVAPNNGVIISGSVGIGTSAPLATLDVRSTSGTTPVASVSGATSFAGLVVDNSGVGDIFTASASGATRFVIAQNGTVTIGNSTDGLVFYPTGGGPTYSGAARPTKSIILSPEYAGAVLTASGSATTTGSMTSDASASAALSNYRTYYEWSSTQTSLQDYTVVARVTLPQDFDDFDTTANNAMHINFNTASTVNTTNKLDVIIYNADVALSKPGNPVVYSQTNVSASGKTWKTIDIDRADLIDNAEGFASPAAGKTMIIYLKMYSSGTYNYTQVGDIVIDYKAKF